MSSNNYRVDGSTRIPRADNGPWDFCGAACCIEFLSANIAVSGGLPATGKPYTGRAG